MKEGNWNILELKYLQQAVRNAGLPWKEPITLSAFVDECISEIESTRFRDFRNLISLPALGSHSPIPAQFILENISVPSYVALFKIADSYKSSASNIDALDEDLSLTRMEAIRKVLRTSIFDQGINLDAAIPMRDLAIELLNGMRLAKRLYSGSEQIDVCANYLSEDSGHQSCISISQSEHVPGFDVSDTDDVPLHIGTDNEFCTSEIYEDSEDHPIEWYEQQAEAGDVSAQSTLGYLLWRGAKGKPEDARAAYWLAKASQAGDISAQALLSQYPHLATSTFQCRETLLEGTIPSGEADTDGALLLPGMDYEGHVARVVKVLRASLENGDTTAGVRFAASCLTRDAYELYEFAKRSIDFCLKETYVDRQELISLFLQCCLSGLKDRGTYYPGDSIPKAKLRNASETFLKPFLEDSEPVLLFHNEPSKFWDKDKEGFAIGPKTLGWKNIDSDVVSIPLSWHAFENVEVSGNKLTFVGSQEGGMTVTDTNGSAAFVASMIRILHRIASWTGS